MDSEIAFAEWLGGSIVRESRAHLFRGRQGGDAAGVRKALAALAKANPRIVAVDGDVKNSTFTQDIENECPERFFQGFIAEQNMIGVAMGFAARGKIAFAASFACFLSRGYDFMRLAAISGTNVKLVGTHAGISIGEDGPRRWASRTWP